MPFNNCYKDNGTKVRYFVQNKKTFLLLLRKTLKNFSLRSFISKVS